MPGSQQVRVYGCGLVLMYCQEDTCPVEVLGVLGEWLDDADVNLAVAHHAKLHDTGWFKMHPSATRALAAGSVTGRRRPPARSTGVSATSTPPVGNREP